MDTKMLRQLVMAIDCIDLERYTNDGAYRAEIEDELSDCALLDFELFFLLLNYCDVLEEDTSFAAWKYVSHICRIAGKLSHGTS